jgi:hypothetical protein
MAETATELEAERRRAEAIGKLNKERGEAAARLAALDTKLSQAENADFLERLGRMKVHEMTLREKSEIVSRLGLDGFLELLGAR